MKPIRTMLSAQPDDVSIVRFFYAVFVGGVVGDDDAVETVVVSHGDVPDGREIDRFEAGQKTAGGTIEIDGDLEGVDQVQGSDLFVFCDDVDFPSFDFDVTKGKGLKTALGVSALFPVFFSAFPEGGVWEDAVFSVTSASGDFCVGFVSVPSCVRMSGLCQSTDRSIEMISFLIDPSIDW